MNQEGRFMTQGFRIRRYSDGDFDAIAHLAVEASASPQTACGQPDVASVNEFHADYAHRPLYNEAWVAEDEAGHIIGFVAGQMRQKMVALDGPIVAPAARQQGVGRALCQAIEQDASANGAETLECGVRSSNEAGALFLERLGYHASRNIHCYELSVRRECLRPVPSGFRVVALQPRYLLLFLMVMHECFPGYRLPSSPQRLFEPDKMCIFLVLDEAEQPVAGVTAFYYPEDHLGYIYHLGVTAAHRRRGLGSALLDAAVDWLMTSHQPPKIGLSTSQGEAERRALYEALGFEHRYSLNYSCKVLPVTDIVRAHA
jgi:ribosomal protein S18 acetylase RimI-like enzyme